MLTFRAVAIFATFLLTLTDIGSCAPKQDIDYKDALEKSLLFYTGQRSGKLPHDSKIKSLKWRGDSHLLDGYDIKIDLSGGWYDAGGGLKFTNTMSYSATLILTALEFIDDGFGDVRNLAKNEVKWVLDYLMKCLIKDKKLVIRVGDQQTEWKHWERPENANWTRPTAWMGFGRPKGGAAFAGDYAAAMAAGSAVFMEDDEKFSKQMLEKAKTAYELALKNKDTIRKVIPDIIYGQYSGYTDELALAAAWLGYATNKTGDQKSSAMYVKQAEEHLLNGCVRCSLGALSWDEKGPLVDYVLYKTTGDDVFADSLKLFLQPWTDDTYKHTKDGIVFFNPWANNKYAVSSSFIAVLAALEGLNVTEYVKYAKGQTDILLGSKGMSYMVGVGKYYPKHIHHRGSSCPATSEPCGRRYEKTRNPNPNELIGALVGGADKEGGTYVDRRLNYKSNEPSLDMNAGLPGLLAGLIKLTK